MYITGALPRLNRMTICFQAYLRRLPVRKRKRRRPRSPRVYVRPKARNKRSHSHTWWKCRPVMLPILILANTATYHFSTGAYDSNGPMHFDTDSFPIGVDSCATCCLTDHEGDFKPGTMRQANTRVEGIGGHQQGDWIGTAQWSVTDNLGRQHQLSMPNTLLVQQGQQSGRVVEVRFFFLGRCVTSAPSFLAAVAVDHYYSRSSE
jgi:hypothetical protein